MKKFLEKIRDSFVRVPLSEKILFAKQLSMMSKAGISTIESLGIIKRQVKSRGFARVIDKAIKEVENGQSLSTAFRHFGNVFGDLFVNIVALGETSGTLSENLAYLSAELNKSRQLKSKIRSAMVYPVIIMIATISVISILVFFVLPKLTSVFTTLKIDLPITTRILLGTVNFIQNYWPHLIGGFVSFIVIMIVLSKIPGVKYVMHRTMLSLPIVGKISKNYNMAVMTRTMGLLLKSGMKILEALSTTSTVVSNVVYKRALSESVENIRRGEALYKYLEEHIHVFPPTMVHMIEIGERTGSLDANLIYLAEYYENEVDETVKNLSGILEPVLLIIMGLIVGFVSISVITPIYSISRGVK